jgi:YVTN family beta-propeller protein
LAQAPTLLILHKGSSSLGFYAPDGRSLAAAPVGAHPHEMVLSADGRFLYTTDNGTMNIEQAGSGGNTVSIIDIAARQKIGEIALGSFRRPHGIDLDRRTGYLAVTTELPDRLLLLDPAKRSIFRDYDTKGKTAHMVTLGKDSRWAWVSHSNSANVAAIHLGTGQVKLIATSGRPEGSALSPDGKQLFVVNREGRKISIIDTASQAVAGEIATGNGPVRIAVTPDGRELVYALIHDKKVEFADIAARKATKAVALKGSPVSLSLSPDGKLAYASDQDGDTVYVISVSERKITREIRTAAGAGPDPVLHLTAR